MTEDTNGVDPSYQHKGIGKKLIHEFGPSRTINLGCYI